MSRAQLNECDFQSALNEFGINALLFRITRLCKDYPAAFRNQLLDFRANWQMREVSQVFWHALASVYYHLRRS